jgi:hypothetical protein
VVVHHFDLLSVAVLPYEADPILVVDPDAVLTTSISTESLEVVARERAQVVKPVRRVQLHQLALSDPGNAPKPPCRMALKERLGVSIPERPDHLARVLRMP